MIGSTVITPVLEMVRDAGIVQKGAQFCGKSLQWASNLDDHMYSGYMNTTTKRIDASSLVFALAILTVGVASHQMDNNKSDGWAKHAKLKACGALVLGATALSAIELVAITYEVYHNSTY